MRFSRHAIVAATLSLSLAIGGAAQAQQSDQPLKIVVMTDFGSVYSDIGGAGNVEGAKMAIEEFGGTTLSTAVSAKKGTNVADLLDQVLLQSEVLDLKSNPDKKATGAVVEAQLDPGKGPVATILVQGGTLHVGDDFICGLHSGRVRALLDERGKALDSPAFADLIGGFRDAGKRELMIAIGGADGLDLVRRILASAPDWLTPDGSLIVEVGTGRDSVEASYPDLPFLWLDTETSTAEVFALHAGDFAGARQRQKKKRR